MTFKRIFLFSLLLVISVGILYRLMLAYKGFTVTSWWRTPWHNAEVGGTSGSLHQIGWAFDVVPVNGAAMDDLYSMPFAKIVVEDDHLHAQIV